MLNRTFAISVFIVVLIGTLFFLCYIHFHKKAVVGIPPTLVSISTAEIKVMPLTVKTLGQIIAPKTIMLKTQVSGIVQHIYFKSGQTVAKNQLLLQLDPTQTQADVKKVFANYMSLKSQYERYLQLIKLDPGAVSADMISQKKQAVKAAKATWVSAKQNLKYMQIHAPYAGVIGVPEQISNQVTLVGEPLNEPAQLNIGSYLQAGTPIAILTNSSHMFVQYQVPQRYSNKLKIGQTVTVKMNGTHKRFHGVVRYISSVVYQNNQSFEVTASITNPSSSMRSGMNVIVTQVIDPQYKIIAIPGMSLVPALSGYSVYVIENSKVKSVPVTIGERYNDLVAITSGLKAGEQVISTGQLNVHPGMAVKVK